VVLKNRFPRPRKRVIDQVTISKFLKTINFKPTQVFQEWRHLLAFGEYQGKPAVFKLASTLKTARYTQNEYRWNEAVNAVPNRYRQHFKVPSNYAQGTWQRLFWFIADWFTQRPFIERDSSNTSLIAQKLALITQANREISLLPLPDQSEFMQQRRSDEPIGERLFRSAREWVDHTPENLTEFLNIIKNRRHNLKTCVNHGDFAPRQLYDLGSAVGIIDGEHAGAFGPLYYDVAYFYIRLRNDHDAPELARQYLKKYQKLLPATEQKSFWSELKPVLCQRYIGDLWGDSRHKRKDPVKMKKLYQLGQTILQDTVI